MYTLYILHIWHIGYLGQSPLSDIFYSHDIFDILQRLGTIGKKRGIYIYCETQPSSIQRLSSIIFPCLSSFVVVRTSRMVTSPLYDVLDHTNHTFSESSWSKDIKTDNTKCLMHKYTNTNTQIHKYSIWRSARKTQHVVYFWKEDCSRISKIIFPRAERTNTKIQIHIINASSVHHCSVFIAELSPVYCCLVSGFLLLFPGTSCTP